MEKATKAWKFFSWKTLCVIIAVCILNPIIWVAFHGIPLMGLPKKEEIKSISITQNNEEQKTITDEDDIELLVNTANLLNYRLFGKTAGAPIISLTYHLKSGDDVTIEANNATMWWHGKAHPIKEPDMFVKIVQGLFFDLAD
ncbi:MAG: hypothetical protein VB078_05290 [Clostridiaceae bacterium]|nr:hypothetical protein [Clostridiaceae bacterium]